tara:strand:+ start:35 stop:247 length:213 start_codon:yes stop_codon:yes gene_type:complete
MFKMRSMAVMKQMDIVAEEIATDVVDNLKQQCDWQIGQFLPESSEGNEITEAHSYLVKLVVDHLNNKIKK